MAWDLLSQIDLPPTPCNLKPFIRCFGDEQPYEGKGKKCWITLDHDNEDMTSLGSAYATEEQIWDEVNVALMETLEDPMGPVFTGRFDGRYLFPASSQIHTEDKLTVPSFEWTGQSLGTIKFSLPLHVFLINNKSKWTCSSSKYKCGSSNEWSP